MNVTNTMKKIEMTMKKWQFEMAPKYTFDYFLQRCQALGSNKFTMVIIYSCRLTCQKLGGFIRVKIHGQ
jgi:hypothetical protein